MPLLDEEIREINSTSNLEALRRRRSGRKSQFTRMLQALNGACADLAGKLSERDCARRVAEARRMAALFDAIQNRIEDLTVDREADHQAEIEIGLPLREDHEQLVQKTESLEEREAIYRSGSWLVSLCTRLLAREKPPLSTLQTEREKIFEKMENFQCNSGPFQSDTMIQDLTSQMDHLMAKLDRRIDELTTIESEAAKPVEPETARPRHSGGCSSRLKLNLPTYEGDPMEWNAFKTLFTHAMDRAGDDVTDHEKSVHLLSCVGPAEAKQIVKQFASQTDCYKPALQALEKRYGSKNRVYALYVKTLLKDEPCHYNSRSLCQTSATYRKLIQGFEDCDGNKLEYVMGATLISRFDRSLLNEWRHHWTDDTKLPTIDDVLTFIDTWSARLDLQSTPTDHQSSNKSSHNHQQQHKSSLQPKQERYRRAPVNAVSTVTSDHSSTSSECRCAACDGPRHSLTKCQTFLDMPFEKRRDIVNRHQMCLNCLYPGHKLQDCRSRGTCRTCKSNRHHTLLHQSESASQPAPPSTSATNKQEGPVLVTYGTEPGDDVILSTARVKITHAGQTAVRRALMDSGSVPSLITHKLTNQLGLDRIQHTATFTHAGGELITSRHKVSLTLHAIHELRKPQPITVSCHVVDSLPESIPPNDINTVLDHPIVEGKTPLADISMGGEIDLLLGMADSLRCQTGQRDKSEDGAACIYATPFGWVLGGRFPGSPSNQTVLTIQPSKKDMDAELSRLWELDQVPKLDNNVDPDETRAIEHFLDTHQQDSVSGRFIVQLPRKETPPPLGETRSTAIKRYLRNEKSLKAKGQWEKFHQVVDEYLTLNHAEYVPEAELDFNHYYLPIHGVVKDSSTTTKLRAVFDASFKSSSGHSLNDQLLPGPNLYPLLSAVINRFRMHQIVISADISKMFREILLHPSECDFHRFLHRNQSGQLVSARMKRLTFGVTSSPYLATQVLRQLAKQCQINHPIVSEIICTSFYVDDCLTGADTVEKAKELAEDLVQVLKSIGMQLRKFRSNSEELLDSIPEQLREKEDLTIQDPKASGRTLGIHWKVRDDTLHIASPTPLSADVQATKRLIASTAAQVFDILGIWAPVTIIARILLQELWLKKVDWDQPASDDIQSRWREWMEELPLLTNFPIPRKLLSTGPVVSLQLHGFSDASTKAYGAVIYLRAVYNNLNITTRIVMAKSRVAPVKAMTIPRLELTAALLLARLIKTVAIDLNIPISNCYAWTDSSIVLSWLHHSPQTLKTYQANRVTAISDILKKSQWRHVRTQDNPADLPSRGILPSHLIKSDLWWYGPSWLSSSPDKWPVTPLQFKDSGDCFKSQPISNVQPSRTAPWKFWEEVSDFDRMVRIVAYCRRFIAFCRRQTETGTKTINLSTSELSSSRKLILHLSQQETYPEVFNCLSAGKSLPKQHPLAKFDVSLDPNSNLIIVSGRVRSIASQAPRCQVVLSLTSTITTTFIKTLHMTWNHPGTSTMLSLLINNYYVPKVRRFLKQLSRQCVICQKAYALPTAQRMGCLPTDRTTPAPPFDRTGIDFAGPFLITRGNPRKPTRIKTYACIFVCLVTRAVHLELCCELSSEAFLACLRRFVGRRGCPSHIYTDNGTNFIGAKNELEEVQQLTSSQQSQQLINNFANRHQLQWHLTPPRTPHFGGLWEAGVKSMKLLLRKCLDSRPLRYDELETILVEVEATLNSRPAEPCLSTDPDSADLITPGHFLIGRPLLALPSTHVDETDKPQLLKRWAYLRRLTSDIWQKWQASYLQSINTRAKWRKEKRNFTIGDIVLIKDKTLKDRSWPLARVIDVHPGQDNIVRVVDLRANNNVYRRSVNQLVLLIEAPSPTAMPSLTAPPEDVRASPGGR